MVSRTVNAVGLVLALSVICVVLFAAFSTDGLSFAFVYRVAVSKALKTPQWIRNEDINFEIEISCHDVLRQDRSLESRNDS